MVSWPDELEPDSGGAPVPVGDLLSRLVSEGKELVAVEVARGKALAATRGKLAVRTGALALAAGVLAIVAVGALAAAAALGLSALGLALAWATVIVGAALALGAGLAGLGMRRSAGKMLGADASPKLELEGGERPAPQARREAIGRAADQATPPGGTP
jgi:hypothetical protein